MKYRIAVKGLGQSDPHDARILKAFALGLAVATRGMDHLRNRVTLEINARINDNPAFKSELRRTVGLADQLWTRRAVARCAVTRWATRWACAGSTKLFNSPSLPGIEVRTQLANVTGRSSPTSRAVRRGCERLISHRLGVGRKDDTLPIAGSTGRIAGP
jgi:aldehyde:ferredoxin oxidoreductase